LTDVLIFEIIHIVYCIPNLVSSLVVSPWRVLAVLDSVRNVVVGFYIVIYGILKWLHIITIYRICSI